MRCGTCHKSFPPEFGKYEYLVYHTIGEPPKGEAISGYVGGRRADYCALQWLVWSNPTADNARSEPRERWDYQLAEKSFRRSIELAPEFFPAYR